MWYAPRAGNGVWLDFIRSNVQRILWVAEELFKKLTTSTSKSTETIIHSGILDVVWEDNRPPTEWVLGTVETVRQAKVAELRTNRGIIRRLFSKLIAVPSE